MSSLVGKRAYLAGPSRTETIAESMPININHARMGATQSPALLGTFFDSVLRVWFPIPHTPILDYGSDIKPVTISLVPWSFEGRDHLGATSHPFSPVEGCEKSITRSTGISRPPLRGVGMFPSAPECAQSIQCVLEGFPLFEGPLMAEFSSTG